MQSSIRWTLVGLVTLALTGCTVGHRITRLHSGNPVGESGQAAYYALPRTVVQVSFPASKTERHKGTGKSGGSTCYDQLGQTAQFPLEDGSIATITSQGQAIELWQAIGLEQENPPLGSTFKITGAPKIGSLPEPDPDQVFRVDLDSSWAIKRQLNLVYGPLGVLESGTSFVQDRRVDLSVAFLKAVTSVAPSLLFRPEADLVDTRQPDEKLDCREASDACQRAACEVYEARKRLYELPERVLEERLDGDQAEWLAKRYRDDIDRGVTSFLRASTEKTEIVCVVRPTTRPAGGGQQSFEVLHHHAGKGFWAGNGRECLIPNGFEKSGPVPGSWVQYDLDVSPVTGQYADQLASAGVPDVHDPHEAQGFYYRVPAVASVRLKKASEILSETQLVVAQLGFVAALPRQRTYQTNYKVTLDPATGALKTLDADSESIDPALISSSGEAIAGALEKRAEAREKEAAAQDELTLLERERKILEERKKIRDLREELGTPEPPLP